MIIVRHYRPKQTTGTAILSLHQSTCLENPPQSPFSNIQFSHKTRNHDYTLRLAQRTRTRSKLTAILRLLQVVPERSNTAHIVSFREDYLTTNFKKYSISKLDEHFCTRQFNSKLNRCHFIALCIFNVIFVQEYILYKKYNYE